MRTKQILTALALPALLAACTADEFDSISNGNAVQGRAALSKNLVLDFDGADTRFSAGAIDEGLKFNYEVGDTIGGAIIDEYHPELENKFPVVNYVSTNHPFVREANGEWTIKHTMVEGHYLFYYPYNENNHERGAVKYSIPVLQDLSDPKTGKFNPKAAVERYNMGIGEQFLAKEDLTAGTTLVNLYNYARVKITIDNHYAGGNVDKIVLKAAGDEEFALNGQISNKKVVALFDNFEKEIDNYNTTAAFLLDNQDGLYIPELNEGSEVVVAKFPANTALKVDGQNNKSIEAYVVLPAASYNPVKVYMYMADGRVYEGETNNFVANRNKIKGLEVTLDAATEAPYVVTSEADWNRYVALVKKNVTAEFTIAGDNFSLSNNAKYPTAENAKVRVEGNLRVSGDNVTMANVKAETITVLKGAKLNVNDQITAAEIINKGQVVVKKVVDKDNNVQAINGVTNVENEETLTVEAEAKAAFALENKKGAVVENNGVMVVSGRNFGTINNNARMNTKGFTNESREYKNGKLVNTPTINNAEGANILAEEGELMNKAVIINNGVLTCKNSVGTITNDKDNEKEPAVLDSKTGAITYITSNKEGRVIVYSANTTNLTIGKDEERGIVEYTTKNASESFKNSLVNSVIASKSLKITEGGITNLTFNGNATLEVAKEKASVEVLTVNEGKTTLGTDLSLTTVIVKEKAMVIVPEDLTMTITGNAIKNEGTILVGGSFVAEGIQKGAEGNGNVEDNGGNSKISWADEPATAEEEFEEAMEEFVNIWIEKSTYATGSWASVTLDNIAKVKWDNTKPVEWVAAAREAFVKAYNEYYGEEITVANMSDVITEDKDGFIAKAIKAAEAAVTADIIKTTIKATLADNSWIENNVYERSASTVKVLDIPNLKTGFVAAVKKITRLETKNAVVLSLANFKEADVTEDMISADSYIGTYKGATEYDVMVSLTSFEADWYKTNNGSGDEKFSKINLVTLDKVKEAAALIYDTYYKTGEDALGIQEKTAIENLNILDKVTTILKWKYSDPQIAALARTMK